MCIKVKRLVYPKNLDTSKFFRLSRQKHHAAKLGVSQRLSVAFMLRRHTFFDHKWGTRVRFTSAIGRSPDKSTRPSD